MTAERIPPPADGSHSGVDWSACLSAHETWLRRVILARTGEPQAVDEVFQQVALAAVEQKAPLTDPAKVSPWLHRLAVIHSARFRRHAGRQRKLVRQAAERLAHLGNGYANGVLGWIVAKERHDRTRLAVGRLAGADAEILMLKYAERWSYRQIAQRLGITEKAVDARLMRARARLRRELLQLGIDEHES